MKSYVDAGSDIIQTNTLNANFYALKKYKLEDRLEDIIREGIHIARSVAGTKSYITLSVGPTGAMMEPFGELEFEEALNIYKQIGRITLKYGVDAIHLETFTDLYEMKAAVLGLKEVCDIPIFSTLAFEQNGKTMMGDTPEVCSDILTRLGTAAVGANCGYGSENMIDVISKIKSHTGLPVIAKPNVGLPQQIDGITVYMEEPAEFADVCKKLIEAGATIIGGCCGTVPEHIRELRKVVDDNYSITKIIPENWEEESLQEMAFDCLEEEPVKVCIIHNGMGDLSLAAKIFTRTVKVPIYLASNDNKALEAAIRSCPAIPGIFIDSVCPRLSDCQIDVLMLKYGCKLFCL
ncbi:MAG: homocysteine S-methyltransferase family protein, partial [Clostridiales bacterium]|jgi:5-methyltetrahydrofolate--homocysteine methyltransferase|nr:homocysteine S-methyltransferase family protein [Clostridiales bacterium]